MDYCVYNKNFLCILPETQINSIGMCEECVIVSISEENLAMLKEKQLSETERGVNYPSTE